MKNIVWLAGLLLFVSVVFPDGITLPKPPPVAPDVDPSVEPSADIVKALQGADRADKARIVSVYSAMRKILQRDEGKRISTTEKLADWQANTLQLAIDTPGKYPGLDVAIEAVFLRVVGTDDVLPNKREVQIKLIKACDIIIASAKK